jgi:hypothetical protein
MPSSSVQPKRTRSQAGLALVDTEQMLDQVARERAALEQGSAKDLRPQASDFLEQIEATALRLRDTLGDAGISVEQSARRLQVSQPTIRKWIGEGLLDAIPGRKPVEVDPRSVVRVERVLGNVRESYPTREWTRALATFLHDRDLAQKLGVAKAIDEAERAGYVDR